LTHSPIPFIAGGPNPLISSSSANKWYWLLTAFVLSVDGEDGAGNAYWAGSIDPLTARLSGTEAGGTSYQRPEDLEIIHNTLYVAVTEGPRDEEGKLSTLSQPD
jgi:hypothetical protein